MRNPRKLQTYDSGPTRMSVGPFFVRIRGQLGFVRLSLGITHVGTFKIKYAPINAKIASGNQAASTGLGCPPIAMIRRHCSSVVAVGTTIAGSSLVVRAMACSTSTDGIRNASGKTFGLHCSGLPPLRNLRPAPPMSVSSSF